MSPSPSVISLLLFTLVAFTLIWPFKNTKIPSLSAPTSDDPCPLPGPRLDLCKPPGEVTGVKHVQRQRGNTLQNYPILALALALWILVLTLAQSVAIAVG